MSERLTTSLTGGVIGNLTSEFWPDIQSHVFHKKSDHNFPQSTPASRLIPDEIANQKTA